METTDRSPQRDIFGIVYKITNKRNGMAFIGKTTTSLNRRFDNHKRNLADYFAKDNKKIDTKSIHHALYKAMHKDNIDNFIIEQLDYACSFEELDSLEGYYIEKLQTRSPNGYNIKAGQKIRHAEDIKTQTFRRHEESKGLPLHCSYNKKKEAYIVCHHPLCKYKQFLVSTHEGSHEKAKGAMLSFLDKLEEDGTPYMVCKEKPNGLPRGICKTRNGYHASYYVNGKRYAKNFRGKNAPDNVNLERAKKWLFENDPKRRTQLND